MNRAIPTECRVAAIDVGSNSVRLMAAQVRGRAIDVLERQRRTTRLLSGIEGGLLTDDAIETTARAIADFACVARALRCQTIRAFGTSAMRDARNTDQLSDRCEALCGLRVELVSGEEEARLSYAGAVCADDARAGTVGVADIGGGSTELLCGRDGVVLTSISMRIGAVRLMGALDAAPWRERASAARALEAAESVVLPHAARIREAAAERWIGVGGTITALAAMTKQVPRYEPGAIEGFSLTRERVATWLDALFAMSPAERRAIPGLSANRADIIPAGCAILLAVMRLADIPALCASDHDNLEGFIRKITNI